jgi:hypothetical protein
MTMDEEHEGPGRPSEYKAEYADQAEKLCLLGATDIEIADFFEVTARTIYRWKNTFPEFCQALKAGKEKADERVERSLYQRAIGYSHEAVKIFMPANAPAPVYAPYREQFPPDTAAAIFWLKNRRPDEWRDKTQQELTGKDGAPLPGPVVNFFGAPEHSSPPQAVGGASKRGD